MITKKRIEKVVFLSLLTGLYFIFFSGSISAFVFNGTVYDINGNPLNNTNITIVTKDIPNSMTQVDINSTTSNGSGWFSLNLTGLSQYGYFLTLVHINSTTNSVDWVGQSLPVFPYSEFSQLSNVTFYLQEAGTLNITVRNSTNNLTTNYAIQIKDTKLSYPIYCTPGISGFQHLCYVPKNRNYSIMVYPNGNNEHFVPVSFNWNNFSSSVSYNISDNNGANLSYYNLSTKTLHKQFNITEGFARISGYIQNSTPGNHWKNFTIVPFLLEPGNIIFMTYGTLPWNASAWNSGQTDVYNLTSGFYNITVPYSPAEIVNYILYASAQNLTFFGSYRNLTVSGNIAQFNFTMYGLLGNESVINMTDSNSGANHNVYTKRQFFNLINSTNSIISSASAHIETKVDYSGYNCKEFTFAEELSGQGDAIFSFPLLNVTGFKEMNIYSQTYSPKNVLTKSAANLISNSNISMASFTPGAISGSIEDSSINIYVYKSNSTCDSPNPDSSCLLTSFTQATARQKMFPIVVGGGKISMRISYSGISVHYVNVDMLASGPPDADFDSAATTSTTGTFTSAMKFGSQGPTIYDYILISIPYTPGSSSTTGLNEDADVNFSIPSFYGEDSYGNMDWNTPMWNSSLNGTSGAALGGNNSHYSTFASEWGILMQENNCTRNISEINSSRPCYIDTSNNKIWIRLPHFSGTSPSISGNVITATTSETTTGSSGGGGGSSSFWSATYIVTNEQFCGGYSKDLSSKQRLKINISGEYHYIGIINLTNLSVTINVSSIPQQAVFNVGEEKKFDINSDNYYELKVKLNSITNKKANLTVTSLHEIIPSSEKEDSSQQETEIFPEGGENSENNITDKTSGAKSSNKWPILLIILIIILILFTVLFFVFKKKH